jgi:predicted transcriptional regulator
MDQDARFKTHRLTITLPGDTYSELERRALAQDVSIAWVIRKAVHSYLDAEVPLFASQDVNGGNL